MAVSAPRPHALGIVPSAVSRQVSELEDWAGMRLINRTTRSLHLTEEGEIYLSRLRHISGEVEALRTLGDTGQGVSGHVRLTAPMMLGQYILPQALARFRQAHPKVELSVSVLNRMVDMVDEGFDLAVRAGKLADSGLIARRAGQVQMITVASPDYLAAHGHPQVPRDLARHNCLALEATARFARWSFRADGKETEVRVSGDLRANDSHCLKALALAGLGIIRLPRTNVAAELEAGTLVEVLPQNASDPLPVHILYQPGQRTRPAHRALIEFLSSELPRALRGQA